MPYNKKSYKSASRYAKYKQCGSMVAQDAAKALAMARQLKKLINVEYKSIRINLDTTPDTTPIITNLSAIAVGDDISDRDGRKIKAFSIQLKGHCQMHETATATLTRIVIFIDNANTGTIPVITDLFTTAAGFTAGQPRITDPQSNSRFRILYDKTIPQSDSGTKMTMVKFYKKLGHHIAYSGTAATDEGIGSLFAVTGSTEATNVPTLQVVSVFKWIDN